MNLDSFHLETLLFLHAHFGTGFAYHPVFNRLNEDAKGELP